MSPRTKYLSKLIGLYSILVSLSMVLHKQTTVEIVTSLIHNPPMLFVTGVIGTAAGLAMVLGHNIWSGGALPVVVTLVGWTALLKGVLLLFLSPAGESEFFLGTLHYEQLFYLYSAISILLGIYLTYAGSKSAAR
jgi:hypothetical protein